MRRWRAPQVCERNALPIFAVLMTLALVAAYHGVFHDPYIFDDFPAIARNGTLHSLAAAIHPPQNTTVSGRPLINLSFALNRALTGDSLPAYHLTNLAILWMGALLLFGLVRRTLLHLGGAWATSAGSTAGIAALLWATHPLQTESVTYLVQRAESIMGLCYLLTLYALARCCVSRSGRAVVFAWGALSVVACWLGMAAKEVMVSAPLVAWAYDRSFVAGSWREALRRRWPMYAAMAASWIWLAALVASTHGRSGGAVVAATPVWARFLRTEAFAVVHYIRLTFWPAGQILDYGSYWVDSPWLWIPAAAGLLGLGLATFAALIRGRPAGWLGLWFLAVLAPTCLILITRQTLAEHRMYLALAPIAIGVVAVLTRLGGNRASVALLVCVVIFTGVSYRRNRAYASALTIWSDVVEKLPTCATGQLYLGDAYYDSRRYPEAERYLRQSLALDPKLSDAWLALGMLQARQGHHREAETSYRNAITYNQQSVDAHMAYGNLLGAGGRLNDAANELRLAVELKPDDAEAHSGYGNALAGLNQLAAAEDQYESAIALNPLNASAHSGFGALLLKQNRLESARMQFAAAERISPELAAPYAGDASALEKLGRVPEALAAIAAAEARDLTAADIRFNHGNLAARSGNWPAAAAAYSDSVRLDPKFVPGHINLAVALYNSGKLAAARDELVEALRLDPTNAEARQDFVAVDRALHHP